MNGSSITGSDPIVITSGTMNELVLRGRVKVERFYWLQPDLSSTSALIISKADATGKVYNHMAVEVSGQSQVNRVSQWMTDMFVRCVPSGTLFIYIH